jgi:hypothetical protein
VANWAPATLCAGLLYCFDGASALLPILTVTGPWSVVGGQWSVVMVISRYLCLSLSLLQPYLDLPPHCSIHFPPQAGSRPTPSYINSAAIGQASISLYNIQLLSQCVVCLYRCVGQRDDGSWPLCPPAGLLQSERMPSFISPAFGSRVNGTEPHAATYSTRPQRGKGTPFLLPYSTIRARIRRPSHGFLSLQGRRSVVELQ